MPRARKKYIIKNLDKIPTTNSVWGDKKVCLICLKGPLKRRERIDVASLDETEQTWCNRCYFLASESAEKYIQ